ncbi:MAG: bactofilin family protein [Bryobacteraceae bacterium]
MWKRREEENAPRPDTQPRPAELAREGIPMQTHPARPAETVAARIGKSVVVKGQIFSREDLYLDGEMEGTLELPEHRVTVGTNGKLRASIKAREVVIAGNVQGNIEASEKIEIRKDARLVGDIRTTRIVIEDGAYFKGSIDIQRPETGRAPAAKPQPAAASAAPAVQAASAASGPQQQTLASSAIDPKRS